MRPSVRRRAIALCAMALFFMAPAWAQPALYQFAPTLVFDRALDALPSRDRSRVFARVRAEQMFNGSLHKQFGPLLAHSRATAGTGPPIDAAAVTATHTPPEPHHAPAA